jgi:hypothetical protein
MHAHNHAHGPSRTTLLHKGIDAGIATFVVLADGSTVTLDTPILRPGIRA